MSFFKICLFLLFNSVHAWDGGDFKNEILSPFETSAKNVFFVGTGLTITVLIFEDSIIDYTQKDLANDRPLGSFSKFGDYSGQMLPNIIYAIGQVFMGASGDDIGYSRAEGMLKASAYSTGITTTLKYSIREPRPGNGRERNSFPSGHTSAAFAFGGYVYEEHGWKWGLPALSLASFVGVSRINDNRHYLHDVLAGMTIGMMYGVGVSIVDKEKRASKKELGVTIIPLLDYKTKGLALVCEF